MLERKTIKTQRLMLRPVLLGDAQSILDAMECPEIHSMHSNGFRTMEDVQRYIEVLLREYENGKFKTWAIALKDTDLLIGSITLDTVPFFARTDLSYWINREHRNLGYATEVVKAMTGYCFDDLGMNRVQVLTSNPASARVVEKAGMQYEGTLRQYFGMNGNYWDVKMYSVLRDDDWE